MKLTYVGLKDSETAFSDVTNIVWVPGLVEDIKDEELAKRMLKHPDVFAVVEGEPLAVTDTQADPQAETLDELQELRAQAKANGIKFHHNHGADKLRELIAAK